MIENIADLPAGIDGLRSSGSLTRADYDRSVVPLVDGAVREGRRLRCLVEIPSFTGISPAAAFEDVCLGLRVLRAFDGCAIVTDVDWLAQATRLAAFLMPYPVRVFPAAERAAAITWLQALPGAPRITHRVLPTADVVVVEVTDPLQVQDVQELATVIDGQLTELPSLHGLVLHATAFPGWENIEGLVAHLRFVLEHHKRIDRIAMAVDGRIGAAAARLAEHVVHAEVRRFGYTDLDAATAWASAQ